MEARYMAEKPEDIEFTMKITATAKEWEELRDQLQQRWPSSRLNNIITDLLSQARKVFYEEKEAR